MRISKTRSLKSAAASGLQRSNMGQDSTVVSLTKQELMQLEMIAVDNDKDAALVFLKELRSKIETSTIKGMKSHLDG
jgi:hypothetical protein